MSPIARLLAAAELTVVALSELLAAYEGFDTSRIVPASDSYPFALSLDEQLNAAIVYRDALRRELAREVPE